MPIQGCFTKLIDAYPSAIYVVYPMLIRCAELIVMKPHDEMEGVPAMSTRMELNRAQAYELREALTQAIDWFDIDQKSRAEKEKP